MTFYLTHEVPELLLVDGTPLATLLTHPNEGGDNLLSHYLWVRLRKE
jgi:hypothetical protein